ncbi:MAG: hypothetical protein A3H69_04350 [Candidatus Sungbacteria bacterium RIFCSPLOWO2_02_FULL_47_9]|uniref:Uncharacterized protein n=1 Tax=Candidatus Sungbacteria bacterium RIFCSPHIGHO2_01_FULL_47_32 TaxID=1802264 RepID=A0A1G2K2R7_9BACT|nr:MAG: hypothetical protein A2633_03115 [Candidatus Sungbacteria bacterium RIFCSPHIGHO2_01_FULL_47_32]OGZ98562.1 MAG: hypothetical protein A3D57_04430 [Candidatus Sungbacteria bacterium RIFCSPHIGHO2_02_FULL_46_12]OHA08708.1 MAG: hypothetical protein A3H69_04350 [Candidatus Sungbacteria bacterium RIFCSPLOWO2_02_FULL_47_9]
MPLIISRNFHFSIHEQAHAFKGLIFASKNLYLYKLAGFATYRRDPAERLGWRSWQIYPVRSLKSNDLR